MPHRPSGKGIRDNARDVALLTGRLYYDLQVRNMRSGTYEHRLVPRPLQPRFAPPREKHIGSGRDLPKREVARGVALHGVRRHRTGLKHRILVKATVRQFGAHRRLCNDGALRIDHVAGDSSCRLQTEVNAG